MFNQKPALKEPCPACLAKDAELNFLRSQMTSLLEAMTAETKAKAAHLSVVTEAAKRDYAREGAQERENLDFSPTVETQSPYVFDYRELRKG